MDSIFPPGYRSWICDICTASCNFEAMNWCVKYYSNYSGECWFDSDQPESNGGAFELMVLDKK